MLNNHQIATDNRLKKEEEYRNEPKITVKRMPRNGDCQFCAYRWSDEKPTNNHSFIKGCKGIYFDGISNEHCDDFKWWYE